MQVFLKKFLLSNIVFFVSLFKNNCVFIYSFIFKVQKLFEELVYFIQVFIYLFFNLFGVCSRV